MGKYLLQSSTHGIGGEVAEEPVRTAAIRKMAQELEYLRNIRECGFRQIGAKYSSRWDLNGLKEKSITS